MRDPDDPTDPGDLIAPSGAGTPSDADTLGNEGSVARAQEDADAARTIAALRARVVSLEAALDPGARDAASGGLVELDDARALQEAGIYRYHHPLEDAVAYQESLAAIDDRVTQFVREGRAVLAPDRFTLDGSLAKGRRMVRDLSKLMLRAYNAEADNCVRALRSGNIEAARRRLEKSMLAIARLGAAMEIRINPEYHAVRIEELELTSDFAMKRREEREEAREQRELLREQRRVEAELAAERERLDKEKSHLVGVIERLRGLDDAAAVAEFEERLAAIHDAIATNDYRAANVRAGYVYVISNIGAFGPDIVKIGLTRRLDPKVRVHELGSASVPFRYDTHALYFSEDAVSLERELHAEFSDRRVNAVNHRREFFYATPAEVRDALARKVGGLLEFHEAAEALEYHRSLGSRRADRTAPRRD